jgi:hypothetical protein
MPLEVTFAPVWQSFSGCGDVVSHGKYAVTAEVKHLQVTPGRRLYSVADKHRLAFWYADAKDEMHVSFTMISSQTHYTVTYNDKFCKVYRDKMPLAQKTPLSKDGLSCLHIIFDDGVKNNVVQKFKPHGNSKKVKTLYQADPTDTPEVSCSKALTTEIDDWSPLAGDSRIGEYYVTLNVDKQEQDLYDADFLRAFANDSDTYELAGHLWCKEGENYKHATDCKRVRVKYVSRPTGSAPLGHSSRPAVGAPIFSNAHMGQDASVAPDAVHLAPLSSLTGLGTDAPSEGDDVLPKPPKRMKKIKFLSDVSAADPRGE